MIRPVDVAGVSGDAVHISSGNEIEIRRGAVEVGASDPHLGAPIDMAGVDSYPAPPSAFGVVLPDHFAAGAVEVGAADIAVASLVHVDVGGVNSQAAKFDVWTRPTMNSWLTPVPSRLARPISPLLSPSTRSKIGLLVQ